MSKRKQRGKPAVGRPRTPLSWHFIILEPEDDYMVDQPPDDEGDGGSVGAGDDEKKKPRKMCFCRHCKDHYENSTDPNKQEPKLMQARSETYKRHLKVCPHVPHHYFDQPAKRQKLTSDQSSDSDNANTVKEMPVQLTRDEIDQWERILLEFQHKHRLADSFIEDPTTLALLGFKRPGLLAYTPNRKALGSTVLERHADRDDQLDKARLKDKQRNWGGRLSVLSDVWKNVSKRHLMAVQLTLFGCMTVFDVTEVEDRHDGIATAQDLEKVMQRIVKAGWRLGSVCTDDAGQCGRARRILAIRWPRIAFTLCFAHSVNNLVRAVLKTTFCDVARDAAAAVNALNASSAKWLVLARACMREAYGHDLAFISLCETRWNSMQGCFASLLRVRGALQTFYSQCYRRDGYPVQLNVLGKSSFWSDLEEAEAVISPLSLASFRLQRDENTVGDVVQSFIDIYEGFAKSVKHRDTLLPSLEQRWRNCEQPLFLLGFVLHPKHVESARKLIRAGHLPSALLSNFAIYYYRRFIGDDFGDLRGEFDKWIDGKLTPAQPSEFKEDTVPRFWNHVKGEGSEFLPDLALVVLSIAVSTAPCERLFSEFGAIHSPDRNRMVPAKVMRIHVVRKGTRDRATQKKPKVPASNIVSPSERDLVATPRKTPRRPTTRSSPITEAVTSTTLFSHEIRSPTTPVRRTTNPLHGLASMEPTAHEEEPSWGDADDEFGFWQEVLDMFDEEGVQDEYDRGTIADKTTRAKEPEVMVKVVNHREPIEQPDTTPFPEEAQKTFPQQKLSGLRAWSASLRLILNGPESRSVTGGVHVV